MTKWDLCTYNAEVYESFGRLQQAQLWRLLRSAYEPKQGEEKDEGDSDSSGSRSTEEKRVIYNYYNGK